MSKLFFPRQDLNMAKVLYLTPSGLCSQPHFVRAHPSETTSLLSYMLTPIETSST